MRQKSFIVLICFSFFVHCSYGQKDTFGIVQFYPTKKNTTEWNSAHWANGKPRTIKYAADPYDPTNWTEDHSATSPGFYIDGKGMMTMSGSPRFHINSMISTKVTAQKFTNIEFTAYYNKKGNKGADYGGMIVGMRGSANGHGSSSGNDCDAQCYMARFRNDGKWDFEKELKHPNTTYYSGSGYMKQDPLWNSKKLPENRWIGMKYIQMNIANDTKVRLMVYIDSVSNGNPQNAVWTLVGNIVDNGTNWQGADITGCSFTNNFMPIVNGGNVFMRTDNDTAQYKMVSIREIDTVKNASPVEITQTINLIKGWNLISLNIMPTNMLVDSVFKSIISQVSTIKNSEGFWFSGQQNIFNCLNSIDGGEAYLVQTSLNCTLTVKGQAITLPYTKQLNLGWNFLGEPSQNNVDITTLVNTKPVSSIKNFEGFWKKGTTSSLSLLVPGGGYFVNTQSSTSLIFLP